MRLFIVVIAAATSRAGASRPDLTPVVGSDLAEGKQRWGLVFGAGIERRRGVLAASNTIGDLAPQRSPVRLLAAKAAIGTLACGAFCLCAMARQHDLDHLLNVLFVHPCVMQPLQSICLDLNQASATFRVFFAS